MDNLISHFKKKTKEVIKNIYCITFVPPNQNQFFNLLVFVFCRICSVGCGRRANRISYPPYVGSRFIFVGSMKC